MRKLFIILFLLTLFTINGNSFKDLPDDELVQIAKDGDPEAQYQLGLLIEELKVTRNRTRLNYLDRNSYYWFELAAEQDHPEALTKVAQEYFSSFGRYKEQNFPKSIELLKRAEDKNSEAALFLAIIYYNGLGIEKNRELSIEYLSKSQKVYRQTKPMVFLEKEFITMIRELTAEENPDALYILGDFYYYGKTEYYPQDYRKAFRIYKQAGEKGNIAATYMVGLMLYNGNGVLKDLQESYIWMYKAAESGNTQAIIKAGIMNYFGEGTDIDYNQAHLYLSIGAEAGESLAQYFLGVMYYNGQGCEIDLELSRKWIEEAYLNGSASAKKFWDAKELWR